MKNPFRALDRALFGTTVIPASARVDPSKFPPEEFPVHCPKCDYLLNSLTEQRCPECGKPFDRGRLLVVQYLGDEARSSARLPEYRLMVWCSLVAGVSIALSLLSYYGLAIYARANAGTPRAAQAISLMVWVMRGWMVVQALLMALIMVAMAMAFRRYRSNRARREQIRAAMTTDSPESSLRPQ